MKKLIISLLLIFSIFSITGCGKKTTKENTSTNTVESAISLQELFTDRDLEQSPDTSNAVNYEVENNKNITITEEGVYVIGGTSNNTTIIVEAEDEDKVQLVLKDLTITNSNSPCIYVKNADKVFITLESNNSLTVNGTFTSDGDTSLDAVIFSKDDIVINGNGSLNITSTDNGISSKDDIKITGGTIAITSSSDAIEANEIIAIKDGSITINSKKDGLHAEYDEDNSTGAIYIAGGELNITAEDDAIHATTILQIDGGEITTNAREGMEATYIQINNGTIKLTSTDDGMNAGAKSTSYTPTIEINGGSLTIDMGRGDTDAIDSNGNLYINGGTISITAQSPFDYDGEGKLNGGEVTVNGTKVTELTDQMMGQGGRR